MPLTPTQIDAVLAILNGVDGAAPSVNSYVNDIIHARDDLYALGRIHASIPDAACATIIAAAKQKVIDAAAGLVTLLT